ncbi:M15 family metallopeptidase [Bradyrhizobium sp. 145]|nr:M15 family metallopeptidase [Bradyrhizobium sp. 145]
MCGSKTKWSNHAYAAAIDLNAEQNGLYKRTCRNSSLMVSAIFSAR